MTSAVAALDCDRSNSCATSLPRGGERQPSVRAPGLAICEMGTAAVRFGDRLHDREPEPTAGAPAAYRVHAGEAVERTREKVGGEAIAVVPNVQLDTSVASCHLQRDLVAAVPECVVDEVAERLFESNSIPFNTHSDRRARRHRLSDLGGAPLEPAGNC